MTLSELVLQRVADWRPKNGRESLTLPETGGWTVTFAAERCDDLGCKLWEVGLRHVSPLADDAAVLRAWADGVAGRVTTLLEPLQRIEVDAEQNVALLRSQKPAQRGELLAYYEALLHGTGEVSLRRYQASAQPGPRREQVAFVLTHEALAKLTADLTGQP